MVSSSLNLMTLKHINMVKEQIRESFDLSLIRRKAYSNAKVGLENEEVGAVNMLLDRGSSHSIWIFEK
jgi:hypothetical protein